MFLFKKREEPRKEKTRKPTRITLITDEYIVDALDDGEMSILQAAAESSSSDPSCGLIVLKDARVQPIGHLKTQPRTFSTWYLPTFLKVIAIVSDDSAAKGLIREENWEGYETRLKALLYAGSFTIAAAIYSDDEIPFQYTGSSSFVPMEEAVITHQLDKKAEPIRGRWGVVNSTLMHGFTLEP